MRAAIYAPFFDSGKTVEPPSLSPKAEKPNSENQRNGGAKCAAVLTARSDSTSLLFREFFCAAAKELLSILACQQFSLKAKKHNAEHQRNGGAKVAAAVLTARRDSTSLLLLQGNFSALLQRSFSAGQQVSILALKAKGKSPTQRTRETEEQRQKRDIRLLR